MRRVVVVLAAVSLIGTALSFLTGCGGSSSSSGSSAPRPQNRAEAAAVHFLDRYVDSDGRVVRRDQGGDTVGEGQAYGMLMAAAIGDQRRFNSIWDWTQKNLKRPDGLISFLWRNGHIVDPQAASDADLDASRALLVASCRFHNPTLPPAGARAGQGDHERRGGLGGRNAGDGCRSLGHNSAPSRSTRAISRPPATR